MNRKELRRQYSRKRSRKSESDQRIKELDTTKIEMMLRMFYNAMYRCLRVDYVLVDSWFTCEALINAVIDQGVRLIGMYKIAATRFSYRGQQLTYSEINSRISKLQRCRSLKYHCKRADVMYGGYAVDAVFFPSGNER